MKLSYGLCDATFSKVWCQGTLGVMPRKSRCDAKNLFIFFNFIIHGYHSHHCSQQSNSWFSPLFSFPNPINPCSLWKPYNPYYFLAYSPPKPNPNSSKPKLYQICPLCSKSDFVAPPCPMSGFYFDWILVNFLMGNGSQQYVVFLVVRLVGYASSRVKT